MVVKLDKLLIYIVIGTLVFGALSVQLIITRRRHGKDHREDLQPILAEEGLIYVTSRWPGMFKVGPFPKFEVEVGRPQSRIGGIRGEYDEYRIVTVQDSQGNIFETWARLEFELFQLKGIRLRMEAGHNVPAQAQKIVENQKTEQQV